MSEFVIECALCGNTFKAEVDYEGHECSPPTATAAMLQETSIKMELPEIEEEIDVKPALSATGEVITNQHNIMKKVSTKKSKKRKKTWSWMMKSPKKIMKNDDGSKFMEEKKDKVCESKPATGILSEAAVTIKPEPVELCEVVSVKDEPAEYENSCDEEMADPLGSTVEDILGLQDEDYLIENFVEYDEELPNTLEIDESSMDDTMDTPVVQRTHKTIAESKHESNVGRRIMHTSNKGHNCTVCNKKFFEKTMLEDHLRLAHRTPRPYACTICNKSFTHKNYVNLHMRVHTGEKPYKCTLCSRSYSHKTSFTIHMRIHNGDRPYECNVCGKKCYDKSGLTSHMRSHTKETPYQCECCGRKFTHSKSLLVHRRNHTGEKPYICPHCGRAFRHWHKHKIHIRLHTGERPYKCQICNKGFPRNDEVKRHMKSHTGIKSFKCSICGVYCATQASITGHINLHHVNLTTDKKFLPEKTIVENSQSGILGKKTLPVSSKYRLVDSESYNQFQTRKLNESTDKRDSEKEESPSNEPSTSKLQTIVSTRPMTPQEKVNNKSMTYRQFLNDQEQQLLAKGLKVVNKNNNTYGLAPISSNSNTDTPAKLTTSTPDFSIKVEKNGLDNAFVKVPNVRKLPVQTIKPATRIILPNYSGNNKTPLVLGEAATKLLLQSVDQSSSHNTVSSTTPQSSSSRTNVSNQQVFIQTVSTSMGGISAPVVMHQQNQQPFLLHSTTSTAQTNTVSSNTITNKSVDRSILQAALTASNSNKKIKPANTIIAPNPVLPDNGNIIVLNKGVAPNPMLMQQPQPVIQQQQLLLLPGINGGPARLILLQPNNQQQSLIKLEPVDSSVRLPAALQTTPNVQAAQPAVISSTPVVSTTTTSTHTPPVQIKQEVISRSTPQPMVQLHNAGASMPNLGTSPPPHSVLVKTELENGTELTASNLDDMATPITIPNIIKLEPID